MWRCVDFSFKELIGQDNNVLKYNQLDRMSCFDVCCIEYWYDSIFAYYYYFLFDSLSF